MSWLKAFVLCGAMVLAAIILVRRVAPLPPLEPRTQSFALEDTDHTPLGLAIVPQMKSHPGLTGIHILQSGMDAFAARVMLARAATRTIDAQYYIWHDDLTGGILFDELQAAADRGVRVRLLLDDNPTSGLDPAIAELDAHPNIEVRLFNPFVIRKPRLVGYLTDFARLNRRMHNKSFTADNQATIIGGRNIGDEYFGARQEGSLFVDLDALAIGTVVRGVSTDFDGYWTSGSAYPANRIVPPIDARQRDDMLARRKASRTTPFERHYLANLRERSLIDQLLHRRLPFQWSPVRLVSDNAAKGLSQESSNDLLFSALTVSLGRPDRRIDLVSGYFVPAASGTDALVGMARRGVKVTVLTNALEATDVPIVHSGYAKRRKALLEAGVRIFELRGNDAAARPRREVTGVGSTGSNLSGGGSALHAKTFAVDGERLFIGSFNFDPRSVSLNTELGFVIDNPSLARRISDGIDELAPLRAYEVRLSGSGELSWIERKEGREITHTTEPGTKPWQRAAVTMLSLLPIEWLL